MTEVHNRRGQLVGDIEYVRVPNLVAKGYFSHRGQQHTFWAQKYGGGWGLDVDIIRQCFRAKTEVVILTVRLNNEGFYAVAELGKFTAEGIPVDFDKEDVNTGQNKTGWDEQLVLPRDKFMLARNKDELVAAISECVRLQRGLIEVVS